MNGPDFYVLGEQKCGTSSLYEMLSWHAHVLRPTKDEESAGSPKFLCRKQRPAETRYMTHCTSYGPLDFKEPHCTHAGPRTLD